MASHFFYRTAFYATAAKKSISVPFAAGRTAATLAVGLSFGAQNTSRSVVPYEHVYTDNFFNGCSGNLKDGFLRPPQFHQLQPIVCRNFSSLRQLQQQPKLMHHHLRKNN